MPAWSVPASFAAVFIGLHYLALRAASGRIGDVLGALFLEGAATLGLVLLYTLRGSGGVPPTTSGMVWACLSGLCISGATSLLFAALRLGGPVASTGTMV